MAISAFWPAGTTSGGVTKVADSTERLALSPSDGDIVVQLDNDLLYEYDGTTLQWVIVGGYGYFVEKAGDTMTGDLLFSTGEGIDSVSSGVTTLNIGATNADVINIGNATATVNINGSVNNNNVTNLNVTDKVITINDGGAAGSGFSSGLEVEENSSATAYVKTSADRNEWNFKAPNQTGVIKLKAGSNDASFDLSSLSASRTYTGIDASGVLALTSTTLTQGSVVFSGASGVLTESNSHFFFNASTNFLGLGTASPAAKFHLSGSISASSWTTNGIGFRIDDQTLTNSSSSGTVALQTAYAIGQPTFAFSNTVTITDACALYIKGAPLAGTNATLTRPWAIYAPGSDKSYFAAGANFGTTTQTSTIRVASSMSGTNVAANAVYASGAVTVSSAGGYQSASLTGDNTMAGTANNTSSIGGVAVDAIARVTNTATVTSNIGVRSIMTNTSTGTVTNNYNFRAVANTNSGGGTVTNQFSFYADAQTMTATNYYGYYSAITSGSTSWNFYAAGTAANYMNGDLRVGTTSAISSAKVSLATSSTNAGAITTYSQTTGAVSSTGSYSFYGAIGYSTTAMSGTADNSSTLAGVGLYGLAALSGTGTGTVAGMVGVYAQMANASAAAVTTGYGVRVPVASNSGGGSIGTFIGFNCDGQVAATNNYGFRGLIASAANSFNLYMSGTADNYLAGRLLVGTTDNTIAKSVVIGNVTTEVTQVTRAVASQTANLQNWQNSTPTTVASIGINGSLTAGPTSSSAATHAIFGSQRWTTRSISGNLTVDTTTTDMIILADTTSSAITVTLPSHAAGRILVIKDAGYNAVTNNITLARAGGTGTIDGASASYTINANGMSVTLVSDGTSAWHVI